MPGSKWTEERRKKFIKSMTGKRWKIKNKRSPEYISKLKKRTIGRKLSDATKEKIRIAMSGENAPNWRGGISKDRKHINWLNRRHRRLKVFQHTIGNRHTFGEWENLKAQYNWTCPCCGRSEPDIKLTEDHIIPLSRGGSDNIENIQPLCRSCNSKKHTKVIKF